MQDKQKAQLRNITTLDQMILQEMRERSFDRILAGLALASLAGGLLGLMVNGVSSIWFLFAVTLLLGLLIVFLLRVTGLFVVAVYLLIVELIGLIAGLLLQFSSLAGVISYLPVLVVIVAGLILSPLAAIITGVASILAMSAVLFTTGQVSWPDLVIPFGLIVLATVLIAEGSRYISILDKSWLTTRETLRSQYWEILEVLKQSERLQQRAVKLEHKLQQLQSAKETTNEVAVQKEGLHTLVRGTVQELKDLAVDLEEFADRINESPPFKGQLELLEQAWYKLDHLTNLIVNLEEMTLLESGELTLKAEMIDLATLIGEVAGTAQGLARGKEITVRHEVPATLPSLYADPYRLRQAVLHILSNAVKYTDEGIIKIEVEVTDSDLMIVVSDTGIGIERADQDRVFKKFGRARDPQAASRQGAGLGLNLSLALLKLHNGRLWMSSVAGTGTTFYIALPLATVSDKGPQAVSPVAVDSPPLPPVTIPAPEEVPPLVRQPAGRLVAPMKRQLGPVARFSSTYIGRFGLALIGLLLIVGLGIAGLAVYSAVNEEESTVTASFLLSNEIVDLPLNPTRRPTPTASLTTSPVLTESALRIEQLPPTPTLPPTATATRIPADTPTSTPSPSATFTATPLPPTASPTPTATPSQTPQPTFTARPATSVASDAVPAALSSNAENGEELSFISDQGLIRKTGTGQSSGSEGASETREIATGIMHTGLSWSPDNRLLFVSDRDGNREIYVTGAKGDQLQRVTQADGDDLQPAWSPDGRRIAFSSGRTGNLEIYVMNADGSGLVRLTSSRGFDEWPAWSPDGRRLAFVSDRDGNVELYTMNVDGSGQQRLTNHPADDWPVAWSPDGRSLVFSSNRDGNWNLYRLDAAGGQPVRLTNDPANERDPIWSPDGQTIAFAYDGNGNWEIYTLPVAPGPAAEVAPENWTRITTTPTDERYPVWVP